MWIAAACGSALFAGLTAVLAKRGIKKTDPDLATALRTIVVLAFSWLMADVAGSLGSIGAISLRSWMFLVLSGLATGASWLCYFKALALGDINKVVPIDKSSTILTVLAAILIFGETSHFPVKLFCTALLAAGVFLMIEKNPGEPGGTRAGKGGWLAYALLSAIFAAATSILAKVGIAGVESNLGTAIRTSVVLVMAWAVAAGKGKLGLIKAVPKSELGFVVLSGLATGASWLCYYYAIQNGVVSVVVPIDKLSILVSIAFSRLAFKERLGSRAKAGLALMVLGTIAMAIAS